jgi:hypothetical protein
VLRCVQGLRVVHQGCSLCDPEQNFQSANEKFDVTLKLAIICYKDYTTLLYSTYIMSDAQFKELLTTAKTLKDNKQDVEAISALEKLIATGIYYNTNTYNIETYSNAFG